MAQGGVPSPWPEAAGDGAEVDAGGEQFGSGVVPQRVEVGVDAELVDEALVRLRAEMAAAAAGGAWPGSGRSPRGLKGSQPQRTAALKAPLMTAWICRMLEAASGRHW